MGFSQDFFLFFFFPFRVDADKFNGCNRFFLCYTTPLFALSLTLPLGVANKWRDVSLRAGKENKGNQNVTGGDGLSRKSCVGEKGKGKQNAFAGKLRLGRRTETIYTRQKGRAYCTEASRTTWL